MTKPDVKTVAKARRMSLIKWERVKAFSRDLINEIDKSCGFCELMSYLAGEESLGRCDRCVVNERCQKIQKEASKIEEKLENMIKGTIQFLDEMDVTEK